MSLALLSETELDAVTGGGPPLSINIEVEGPTIQRNFANVHAKWSNVIVQQSNTVGSVASGNNTVIFD